MNRRNLAVTALHHTHARTLLPAALAYEPRGFVLVLAEFKARRISYIQITT